MEYDRVFASMAIPACCWRRTGEIFRGNKEMAELIQVPMEELRDVCFFLFSALFLPSPFPSFAAFASLLANATYLLEKHLLTKNFFKNRENWPSTKSWPKILWSLTGKNSALLLLTSLKKPFSHPVHSKILMMMMMMTMKTKTTITTKPTNPKMVLLARKLQKRQNHSSKKD